MPKYLAISDFAFNIRPFRSFMSNFSSSLIKFCMASYISKASCLLPITPDMMLSTYDVIYISKILKSLKSSKVQFAVRFICFNLLMMFKGKIGQF